MQFIAPNGDKRYLPGPKPSGLFYSIGTPSDVICIAAGFATAASIHQATGHATAVAFDCGNIERVTKKLREKFAGVKIVICADDDFCTDENPGMKHAVAAARLTGACMAAPKFGINRPDNATDFNDHGRLHGPGAIRDCIQAAVATAPPGTPSRGEPVAGLVCAATITPKPIASRNRVGLTASKWPAGPAQGWARIATTC